MKICVVSDSHDRAPMLTAAVAAARKAGAELVIHCGDLIGAMTLRPLLQLGLPVHVVHGNNQGDPVALWNLCRESAGLITYHGADIDLRLAGRRLFATHYPHYARGLACTGDYDVVCCGHSHVASVVQQPTLGGGMTWLVNPGSVAGLGAAPTWLLADLANFEFEIRPLD
ncbi:MAG: metallophosphoesterase [Betaproteobacteria bacterium HGW-Betaproteobacteria-18]|nr:MAG: metallophosphoesterase [Betaproteobacteria bacterium HGW-Betaproteobacteria-18]